MVVSLAWVFNPDNLTLESMRFPDSINPYYVDLERITSRDKYDDIISHIAAKVWATDETVDELINEIKAHWDVESLPEHSPSVHIGKQVSKRQRKYQRHVPALLKRDGVVCGICKGALTSDDFRLGIHVDHIVPLGDGGGNELDNLQLAHSQCNLRKPKKSTTIVT